MLGQKTILTILLTCCTVFGWATPPAADVDVEKVIVQADSVEAASAAVLSAGGSVERPLAIINAVSATVSAQQRQHLTQIAGIRVINDGTVKVNAKKRKKKRATQLNVVDSSSENTSPDATSSLETTRAETSPGQAKNTEVVPPIAFPSLIGADLAHASGYTGRRVTVAVLDTGFEAVDGMS